MTTKVTYNCNLCGTEKTIAGASYKKALNHFCSIKCVLLNNTQKANDLKKSANSNKIKVQDVKPGDIVSKDDNHRTKFFFKVLKTTFVGETFKLWYIHPENNQEVFLMKRRESYVIKS